MPLQFIPNTALATCVVDKNGIYTYAQLYNGELVEIKGKLSGSVDVYQVTGDQTRIEATKKSGIAPAKRFTPLAAVVFHGQVRIPPSSIYGSSWLLIVIIIYEAVSFLRR